MPRPQAKKYAEIDGKRVVVNLAACSQEVAAARGYIRAAAEVEIGDKYVKRQNAFTRTIETVDPETGETVTEVLVFPVPVD